MPVRYKYSSQRRKAVCPYSQVQQSIINSYPSTTPKLQLFSRSHSLANRRIIIYVVDHIKRTNEERGDKRQEQLAARRGGKITHEGGRQREVKMRYPLTVLFAPLVLELPFVVLGTGVDGRERGRALRE